MRKLLVILLFAFAGKVYAQNPSTPGMGSDNEFGPGLYWSHIPAICGVSGIVNEYLQEHKFILENMSVGRRGATEDGQPVYMVSYFINEDKTQTIAVITSPTGHESCMMYKSFDLQYPGSAT